MGEHDTVYYSHEVEQDRGPGIENYECENCRADRVGILHCGTCPCNDSRMREYNRKYIY